VTVDNPPHQDPGVPVHRVHLALVLALLRVLAGPRGHAAVTWWAGGFTYTLKVHRRPRAPYVLDYDPDAGTPRGAIVRLRAYLHDYAAD
jgi:hypothetical protein